MNLSALVLFVFAGICLVNVLGEFFKAKKKIRWVTTPLALPLLIFYVFSTGTTPWLLILGLLFSLAGDVLLMFPEERSHRFFLFGTLSFLITHLVYSYYFSRNIVELNPPLLIWILIGVICAGSIGLFLRMWKNLGFLRPVVGLYTIVLAFTASIILLNYPYVPRPLFLQAAGGILLFLISDSGLSQDWFIEEFPLARPFAMVTYFAGQFLIVHALTAII